MKKTSKRLVGRIQRHKRVRRKISGTASVPRLSVFRSAKHIYVQAIDDTSGATVASASTLNLKDQIDGYSGNKDAASKVGTEIAKQLVGKSINQVVFDRGGFLYQGRVKELANAAREAGLQF